MAVTTFTLPTGTKFRTQSHRRFVVVAEYTPGKPVIEYRTDVMSRAITRAAKIGLRAHVVDTLDSTVRIPGMYHPATRTRTPERWVMA
jgi:hypothetical protein